jgi:hypothetical protein
MLAPRGIIRVVERCASSGTRVTTPRDALPSRLTCDDDCWCPWQDLNLQFRRCLSLDAVPEREPPSRQRAWSESYPLASPRATVAEALNLTLIPLPAARYPLAGRRPVTAGCAPLGSGAARPGGALRAIDASACPRCWRTFGPRRRRRRSEPALVATHGAAVGTPCCRSTSIRR